MLKKAGEMCFLNFISCHLSFLQGYTFSLKQKITKDTLLRYIMIQFSSSVLFLFLRGARFPLFSNFFLQFLARQENGCGVVHFKNLSGNFLLDEDNHSFAWRGEERTAAALRNIIFGEHAQALPFGNGSHVLFQLQGLCCVPSRDSFVNCR